MEYTINNMFRGLTKNVEIVSFGQSYYIPLSIYQASFISAPTTVEHFKHTIEPKLDNVEYKDAVEDIIEIMYGDAMMATHCGSFIPRVSKYIDNNTNKIPYYLSIIDWCAIINRGFHQTTFINNLFNSVRKIMKILSALVTFDNTISIKKYIALAEQTPISIPDNFINRFKLRSEIYSTIDQDDKKIIKAELEHCMRITYYDIITRELDLLLINDPKYMKIPNFGVECAAVLRQVIRDDTYIDVCIPKYNSRIDICDVFMNGLAYSLIN